MTDVSLPQTPEKYRLQQLFTPLENVDMMVSRLDDFLSKKSVKINRTERDIYRKVVGTKIKTD